MSEQLSDEPTNHDKSQPMAITSHSEMGMIEALIRRASINNNPPMTTEQRPAPETDAAFSDGTVWDFVYKLQRDLDEARKEIDRTETLLLDKQAVHLNFLHGKIAKLDWEQIEHIHGPHPIRMDLDEAQKEIENLKDQRNCALDIIEALKESKSSCTRHQ